MSTFINKKMKRLPGIGILGGICILCGGFLFCAWAQDVGDIIRRIDGQQQKIQTLRGDFSQRRETALTKEPLLSSGRVQFKRPDQVHWTYLRPEPMEMAVDGKDIWIYRPNRGQAEKFPISRSRRLSQYLEPLISIFQKPFALLASDYDVEYRGAGAGLYQFRLHPKNAKVQKYLSGVDLSIDQGSGAILKFDMAETNGDRLILEFKNLEMNIPLSDDEMKIKIPPSVRVEERVLP